MSSLERAIALAAQAHAGQVDKGGAPYILHPLRVMLRLTHPEARIVAVLHDVLEDCPITPEQLRGEGFGEEVLAALLALTKVAGEDYPAFIRRAGANPLARQVKLADLAENSDLSRIPEPGAEDLRRLEKYRQARDYLNSLARD
ncbi:HD domain-containing protein [Pseudomonas sp. NFPP10]|uniref:HD domain-containing protein n=1 Tax=Pseudomonas TaxID=286 RepID=UPI00088D979D|nr:MULTISPECIES: HD domain-containing protein [Pseudomonas]POA88963.1 HD domain-containing protein [Pseudomonas protegens]SDA14108.1 HD domain-containing protein [Pseudomonas sp. NFPP12]SEM51456.1 HD domain-containing protein [Pseudomonas sp. NFPP10]SES00854.1 HD domain-containing protein [Pseudomonas sp. NFPP19]SFI12057.1 HD domain-containing protein [Pseudomonas sp. NFPP08]